VPPAEGGGMEIYILVGKKYKWILVIIKRRLYRVFDENPQSSSHAPFSVIVGVGL